MPASSVNGVIFADKPKGISSHRVVAIARRRLGLKKIGHAGTLDPMATGLLILGVGSSTRLLTYLVGLPKRYTATMRLGIERDSDDADGTIVAAPGIGAAGIDHERLEAAMAIQRGTIAQVPSTVSAIKVDGRRAYALARSGERPTLAPRMVTISRFDTLAVHEQHVRVGDADVRVLDVDVDVSCTSGTYVRALARDVGSALGVGGHLTALRRVSVGPFDVSDAVDLSDEEIDAVAALRKPSTVARALFPTVELDASSAAELADGKRIETDRADDDGPVAAIATDDDRLIGLVSIREGRLRTIANFPKGTA